MKVLIVRVLPALVIVATGVGLGGCADDRATLETLDETAFRERVEECGKLGASWRADLRSCDLVNAIQNDRATLAKQKALEQHRAKARAAQEKLRADIASKQAETAAAFSSLVTLDKNAFDNEFLSLLRLIETGNLEDIRSRYAARQDEVAILDDLIKKGRGIVSRKSTVMYNPAPAGDPFVWEPQLSVKTSTASVPDLGIAPRVAIDPADLKENDLPTDTQFEVRLPSKRASYWVESRIGWNPETGKGEKNATGGAYLDLTASASPKGAVWELRVSGGGNTEFNSKRYAEFNPLIVLR